MSTSEPGTSIGQPASAEQELFDPDAMFGGFEPPSEDAPPESTDTDAATEEQVYKDDTLWKKFSVYQGVGRFCSVRLWLEAGRVIVDIGETDANTNKLKSNTATFLKVVPFATWLRAVANGQAEKIYPPIKGGGVSTPENFMVYGGGMVKGQPVSRVFKAHYWPTGYDDKKVPNAFDGGAFQWKTVLYTAKQGDKGQFIPTDMGKPLSANSIKMTRAEMAEISFAVDMALTNMASSLTPDEWLPAFIGKRE